MKSYPYLSTPLALIWAVAAASQPAVAQADDFINSAITTPLSSEVSQLAHVRRAPDLRRELALQGLWFGAPIYVQIFKESRELDLYVRGRDGFELFKNFPICRISGSLGPKRYEGDYQAPEGFYRVEPELMHPNSEFHLAFNIGYPNEFDSDLDRSGSNIMVHGGCVSRGCFAMTNGYMEKIYTLAEAALLVGQPSFEVHVFPFRMTGENMHRHRFSRWHEFWETLKPGYDYFLEHRQPPRMIAEDGRYRFHPDQPQMAAREASPRPPSGAP